MNGVVQIAKAYDDALVVAQYECAARIERVEGDTAVLSDIVGEKELVGAILQTFGDGAEHAWGIDVHCAGQCGVLVHVVVNDDKAGSYCIFVLRVVAGREQQ